MEVGEQIKVFRDFIEKNYYAELLEKVRKGDKFIVLDFLELTKFNPELADELLETPEEILKAGELAIKEFDLPKEVNKFYMRFKNLPESQKILVSEIRSKHLNKFFWTEGVVRQKSDVRPQVVAAKFECPSCGNILTLLQLENTFREPSRCSCGRKGKFKEISKELVDGQGLVLEEATEDLEGGAQPKRMNVFLKNDLVSPITEKKSAPGNKVRVTGWVTEVPINLKSGGKSTKFDLMIEANLIEAVHEDFSSIEISEKDEERIKELAKDPKIYNKLIESIAPSIFGYEKVKEALILQLVGGVRKERKDETVTRGDMHVLLIGDPGAGKSQLLKRLTKVAPKGRYVSGKGVSGAGLTAAVVKDEFLGGWSLEAGALVLANKGFCVTGETKILLDSGELKKIKEVVSEFRRGEKIKVKSFNTDSWKTESAKVIGVSDRKSDEVYKVIFNEGTVLEITGNHKLPFWDNGIRWREVEKAKEGEYLIVPLEIDIKNKKVQSIDFCDEIFVNFDLNKHIKGINKTEISKRAGIPKHRLEPKNKIKIRDIKKILEHANKKRELKKIRIKTIPQYLNKEFMEWLGLIYSDGHLNKRKGLIIFFNSNKDLLQRYRALIKKVFGIDAKVWSDKRGRQQIYFSSTNIKKMVNSLGIVSGNKSKKPLNLSKILNFDKELIKSFLVGVINGDGSISNRKGGGIINIIGGNKTNLEWLRLMLKKIGIVSGVNKIKAKGGGVVKKGNYITYTLYTLSITGISNIKKIYDKRLLNYKLESLKKIIRRKDNSFSVPLVNKIFRKINKALPYTKKNLLYKNSLRLSLFKKGLGIKRRTIINVVRSLEKLKGIRNLKEFCLLKKIIEKDISFIKIIKIRKKEGRTVYNLQTDSKRDPNYFANFIPVHNCMIDELDKMGKEDRAAMHEALEGQTVSISKANIQATLRAETTVLAAANPKFGRFDPYGLIIDQIDLPPTLINRFDLIFPIKDLPNKEKDEKMADHILTLHQKPEEITAEIETELLKKYIAYARQKIRPIITEGALKEIKSYYIQMRGSGQGEEGGIKSIPITARQLEALIRLAEASAKVRLSDKVMKKDAQRAIDLINYCLSQVAKDLETGIIDIDRISSGIPAKERSKISIIREIIDILEGEFGKVIPIENVMERAEGKGLKSEEVEEIVERLRRSGDLYEPRKGFLSRI